MRTRITVTSLLTLSDLAAIAAEIDREGRPNPHLAPGLAGELAAQAVAAGAFDDAAHALALFERAINGELRAIQPTSWLDSHDLRLIAHAAAWEGHAPPWPDEGCRGAYAENVAQRYVQGGSFRCEEDALRFIEQALTSRCSPDEDRRLFGPPPSQGGTDGPR